MEWNACPENNKLFRIEKCAAATGRWQTGETLAKIEQTISNLYPGPGAMLNHGEWLKITEPEMRELRRKSQDKEFSVFEDALRELSAPVPENQRQRRLRYPIKLCPDNVVDMGNHLMKDQIVTLRRLIESLGTEHAWRFEVIYRGYASLGHEIPWERQMATQGRFSIS